VASQDRELRREMSRIPGVALFHIIQNTMVLEPTSDATKRKVEEVWQVGGTSVVHVLKQ